MVAFATVRRPLAEAIRAPSRPPWHKWERMTLAWNARDLLQQLSRATWVWYTELPARVTIEDRPVPEEPVNDTLCGDVWESTLHVVPKLARDRELLERDPSGTMWAAALHVRRGWQAERKRRRRKK